MKLRVQLLVPSIAIGVFFLFSYSRVHSTPCFVPSTISCSDLFELYESNCETCGEDEYAGTGLCDSTELIEESDESYYPSTKPAGFFDIGKSQSEKYPECAYPEVQCGKVVRCSCEHDYNCDEEECYDIYFCVPDESNVFFTLPLWGNFITGSSCGPQGT